MCIKPYLRQSGSKWMGVGNFVVDRYPGWDQGVVSLVYVFFVTLFVKSSSISAIPQFPTLHQQK